MSTNSFVANVVIALECPACDGTILVDQLDLGDEIRCDSCLVAFVLEPEPVARLAPAALAA
ncbi:MAG: hypothetical protein ACRDGQ_12830 [Candidatus Limnocylindrales bacterium]